MFAVPVAVSLGYGLPIVTVGASVYPTPGLVITILLKDPFVTSVIPFAVEVMLYSKSLSLVPPAVTNFSLSGLMNMSEGIELCHQHRKNM